MNDIVIDGVIDLHTFNTVEHRTELVERKPSEARPALYLERGSYKIKTTTGWIERTGPMWVLWDSAGYPYAITSEEFEKLYVRKDEQ